MAVLRNRKSTGGSEDHGVVETRPSSDSLTEVTSGATKVRPYNYIQG